MLAGKWCHGSVMSSSCPSPTRLTFTVAGCFLVKRHDSDLFVAARALALSKFTLLRLLTVRDNKHNNLFVCEAFDINKGKINCKFSLSLTLVHHDRVALRSPSWE
jgi:hypothetical protein